MKTTARWGLNDINAAYHINFRYLSSLIYVLVYKGEQKVMTVDCSVVMNMESKHQEGTKSSLSVRPEYESVGLIYKKIRNAKKRLRGIEEIEAKLAAGKELNADQVRGVRMRNVPTLVHVNEAYAKSSGGGWWWRDMGA